MVVVVENENKIYEYLKSGWIVYISSTQPRNMEQTEYNILSSLVNNNAKNIKTVSVFDDEKLILIKKDYKTIREVLNLKDEQIKNLTVLTYFGPDNIIASFNKPEDIINTLNEIIENRKEAEDDNNRMYR